MYMKILSFSYLSYDDNHYKGGGWVNSLINVLIEKTQYEIGVVYIAKDNHYKNIYVIIYRIMPFH